MRLRDECNPPVLLKVEDRLHEQGGVVSKSPEAGVAFLAEKATHLFPHVVMVNVEAVSPIVESGRESTTKFASSPLLPVKLKPFVDWTFRRRPILAQRVVLFPKPDGVLCEGITADLLHTGHGGVRDLWPSSVRVLRAARFVFNHLPNIEYLSAPFTGAHHPGPRSRLSSIRPLWFGCGPAAHGLDRAEAARVGFPALMVVMEVSYRSWLLAMRAESLIVRQWRDLAAFAAKVFLDAPRTNKLMTPDALDGGFHCFVRFGHFVKCLISFEILKSLWHQPQGALIGGRPTGLFGCSSMCLV
jgi:hypothetical protein